MNGIYVLTKEPQKILALSTIGGHGENTAICWSMRKEEFTRHESSTPFSWNSQNPES
jgi:hypothetical protein